MNTTSNIKWLNKEELFPEILKNIKPALIGYDIGTGIYPHEYFKSVIYVCCEPFSEYVDVLNEKILKENKKNYVVLQKDWEQSIEGLLDKSIDSLYLMDVIEHLTKEEGLRLLKLSERVVRKQIVIFTPIGLTKQEMSLDGKDAWGFNGAHLQEHKSGWFPEDFSEDWDVYACKDFHQHSNIGTPLDVPFGAFCAIKNIEEDSSTFSFDSIPFEIKNVLVNKFPDFYFDLLESKEYQNIKILENQILDLKNELNSLLGSRSMRLIRFIKTILRINKN